MTAYWKSGMRITAARSNRILPIAVTKNTATPRNTTTTATADPELFLELLDATVYDIRGALLVTSAANAAGDFKYGWEWTGTMAVITGGVGPDATLASASSVIGNFARLSSDSSTPTAQLSYGTSTAGVTVPVNTRVVVTSGGILTLDWAQDSSNANNTTLEAGSFLTATPVIFN